VLLNDVQVFEKPDFNSKGGKFIGLWDTGATNSCITQNVVTKLDIKPISKTNVYGVHGEKEEVDVYLVSIFLPNEVGIKDVTVTLGELGDVDVLLGMDIILNGDFAITNHGGKTIWSFRVPSVEPINFVDEIEEWKKKKNKTFTKKSRPSHRKKPRNPKKKR